MCRRRVRRVNLPRSAREADHQSPSPPLPMTTSAKGARPTRQPSESGAGPRRTPREIIILFDWMHCIRLWNVLRRVDATTLAPTTTQNNTHFLSLLCSVPRTVYCCNCLVISISHHSSCTARFRSIRFLVDTVFS
jgi:hypothetical protein